MNSHPFNLENAVAAWRAFQEKRRVLLKEDLDELESHLHEHTQRLTQQGMEEGAAFEEALRLMGDFDTEEYSKVYWRKVKRQRQLIPELAWRISMLNNYFKVALRALKKQKGYAFINIFGLSVGLACFILIALFVQYEFSYDRLYENAGDVYRVVKQDPGSPFQGNDYFAVTPAPLAQALEDEFPEVIYATTIDVFTDKQALLTVAEMHFWEPGIWADDDFFNVLPLEFIRGNRQNALENPFSIVLTESLTARIFGAENPIGKSLMHQNQDVFTVTGVIPDVPENASLQFAFVRSINSLASYTYNLEQNPYRWENNSWYTFFLMPDASLDALQSKLPALTEKYVTREDHEPRIAGSFHIQALTDLHLKSHFNIDVASLGNIRNVRIFLLIGLIVLLLACINYTNLAIARSIQRTREIGLRKVIGAQRRQLAGQFLGESVLMTVVAFMLACVMAYVAIGFFASLVNRPLRLDINAIRTLFPTLCVLILIVGLFAGGYPAFLMSSVSAVDAVKKKFSVRQGRFSLQRLLLVFQFTASIALIAGALVIYQQLRYIQSKDLGFEREHILSVTITDDSLRADYPVLRQEWLKLPGVESVTFSSFLPGDVRSNIALEDWQGRKEGDHLLINQNGVGPEFLDLFDIELLAGRSFSPETGDYTEGFLINEAAASALGWTPADAIGKIITFNANSRPVIGVVKDFHINSLHRPIEPLLLHQDSHRMAHLFVRVDNSNLDRTLAQIHASIDLLSAYPVEYHFLDDQLDALYGEDRRLGQTIVFFTFVALIIALLGLFGLAAYATEQRTKEIGIRKVLGATVSGLVIMLAKDFTRLVLISTLLATPIAYFAMKHWLESFAYHVDLGAGVFFLTGGLALTIAVFTVSYQAVRASIADPVKSIRHE